VLEIGKNYSGKGDAVVLPRAAGAAATEVMYCPGCRDLILQFNSNGMAAGEEYTLTVEGQISTSDGWDNLSITDATYEITEDGDTLVTFDGAVPPYVRISVVETLNTPSAATLAIAAMFGGVS